METSKERTRRLLEARSKEELQEAVANLLGAMPPEVVREAEERGERKAVRNRLERHVGIVAHLLATGKQLVHGESYEKRYDEYVALVRHVEKLWLDGTFLFEAGTYTSALFLSLVAIEETGKVGVARFQVMGITSIEGIADEYRDQGRHPFYSHRKKHLLAAGAGALINARLDRILGEGVVTEFLDDVESGKIEDLRQAALYADRRGDGLWLPERRIDRDQALRYLILAGEIMTEVLGFEPDEWERLLTTVKAFEAAHGFDIE